MKKEKVVYDAMAIRTGLRRGYVRSAERGVKNPVMIDEALRQPKNSNEYKIVKQLLDWGADKVYKEPHQDSRSSQYMYYVYIGEKEV